MGYIKENKATIDSLSTTNINNENTVSTVFLQAGIVNVTENLITNSLTTESFKQPVENTGITETVNLTRNELLNKAIYIYEYTVALLNINLPKMTSVDVGLVIRIGRISSNSITIKPASGDYLNSTTPGGTDVLSSNQYIDIILYKVIAGVSYWITS